MGAGTQGWRGTGSPKRFFVLLVAAFVASCGGGSSGPGEPEFVPTIQLEPDGDAWSAAPANTRLTKVSNNGFGYTGEIDRYEIDVPAAGRLQVSLTWNHEANFDVILASDDLGKLRLAEGLEDGSEPEYVGTDVVLGQTLFLFVAGWAGDPGPYHLELVLLPPTAPLFAIETAPDFDGPMPSDAPFTFTFTTDLDPVQDLDGRISLVHAGGETEGEWCIDGRTLTFFPQLPETPGDSRAMIPGELHVLQMERAADGLRAATGEYLSELVGFAFRASAPVDFWPVAPEVIGITPSPSAPYHGEAITIALSEPLDPETLAVGLVSVFGDSSTAPLPFAFHLSQAWHCSGAVEVRLLVAPKQAPPAGTTTRLTLPAGTRALAGGPHLAHGSAVTVDFPPP